MKNFIIHIFYLLTFIIILVEFIQLSNTHRLVKTQKFYRPNKPWRHKPQRHLLPHVPKRIYKKKPPWKPHHHPRKYRPIHSSHITTVEIYYPKRTDDISWWISPNFWTSNRRAYSYGSQLNFKNNNQSMSKNHSKLTDGILHDDKLNDDDDNNESIVFSSDSKRIDKIEHRRIRENHTQSTQRILSHCLKGG